MNYIGRRIKRSSTFHQYKEQAYEILNELKEVGIRHRDINRKNFLFLFDKLYLIDFGWCIFKDEDITKARKHRNLRPEPDEERFKEIFE